VRTGGIIEDDAVRRLVRLPAGYRLIAIVSLGYPAEEQPPRRRTSAAEKTLWLE